MILFIGVTYKTPQKAARFVRQVLSATRHHRIHVVIVDNGNERGDLDSLSGAPREDATWVGSEKNLGYFGGAHFGLQSFLDSRDMPQWVVVSNVDLEFDATSLASLLHRYDGVTDVGVVAPAVVSKATGWDLNPFMLYRPSALRMHAYKWLFSSKLCLQVYSALSEQWRRVSRRLRQEPRRASAARIYAVHGSILPLSINYFVRGGSLAHGAFMYGEEITVAETCRALSLAVVLDPSVSVLHLDEHSTSRRLDERIAQWIAEGARYSAETYFPFFRQ